MSDLDNVRFIVDKITPNYVEFADADGIWVRFYDLPKIGLAAPQHSHRHDHVTLLCRGSVRAYKNDMILGTFAAPAMITIPAGDKHLFVALSDNVLLACVHNMKGREELLEPEIMEEYQIV
jgi:hypothetical protein